MNVLSEQRIEYLENELKINLSRIEKIQNEIKTKEMEMNPHDIQEIHKLKSKLSSLLKDGQNYTRQIYYEKKQMENREKNLKVIESYFDF